MQDLLVVKIGGNVVDNEDALATFLKDFASIRDPKVLVHGGGKIATKISKALGIEAQMIDGRRVTDAETLDVVTMVYAGLVNKKIVAGLQRYDCNAIGLSGADANVIRSKKREAGAVDYGFVADVEEVNGDQLSKLINDGLVPIMAPITHDKKGLLLNTNADTVASAVAVGLSKRFTVSLCYCFELPGVLRDRNDPKTLIERIDKDIYGQLKADGTIVEGMIPKLDNCFDAIDAGVSKVKICHANELTSLLGPKGAGTTLSA